MDAKIAQLLVEHSDGELKLYEGYSGRGMMGSETTGVYGSSIETVIAYLDDETIADAGLTRHELHKTVKRFRTDNLAFDTIWY